MQIEVIRRGDSLWSIAQRYGVPVADIVRVNQLDPNAILVVGQAIVVPTVGAYHTVKPGESLWTIANQYKVTVAELQNVNHIANPSLIHPGMVLRIPVAARPTIESNAYLQPSNTPRETTLVQEVAPFLTYLSLFSYRAESSGNLVPLPDETALNALNSTNTVPMMVITNFANGTFSAEVAHAIFTDPAARNRLITSVLDIMGEKKYFSLNVDFEHIFPADREAYNDFLRELSGRVREQGHLISSALAPKASATQVGQWYEAHDYPAHGQIVDFVVLMTYEWGWSGGPPMAVAPIPQVRKVLDYAVSVIPPQKIMMGAPLYGYDWTLPYVKGGPFARSLSPRGAVQLAAQVGAAIEYDYTAQAPHFTYYDPAGKQHIVWFEDARSMQAKFNLIKEYGLRGISYWVLGNPFPENWSLLEANFQIKKYK
ncbi:MAG: lysM domain protein [Paenibacillaceae bacterium]|jgi:spore germination protein|nr:lysM domain protein [Paenibacillaceae bacterium]